MVTSSDPLEHFFNPRGIVIVGASTDIHKLGYSIARNLIEIGYPGTVHFVNPRAGQLFGRPIYTRLADVPDPVDLAVLLIPAASTPEVLRECGIRGIKAVIIVSSGFRESSAEGCRLEAELSDIAHQFDIRIIGPNCIGIVDTHLPLDTTFLKPPSPPVGNIAFISHSGATCAAVIDWSRGQGFGFSRLVSLGNQIDINETDMLTSIAEDPTTKAIALYLESVSDGRHFIEVARVTALKKPIVALKSGRNASGQAAAASHTGALAGEDSAFEAAFKKAGIIRADTVEKLFEWSYTLSSCPLPKGRSIAVLTSAGGLGVAAVDALEANELHIARLSDTTRTELQTILPAVANTSNPVDMLASATPEQYADCLRLLLADPRVDGVLMIILPPPFATDRTVSEAVLPIIESSTKAVITALVGEVLIQPDLALYQRRQIPEFRFPERAAAAMAALVKRAEFLSRPPSHIDSEQTIDPKLHRQFLQEIESGRFENILAAYKIPSLPFLLAKNRDEVAALAQSIGFPLVLKIATSDISHKSDIGGVILNINDVISAQQAFDQLILRINKDHPQVVIQGVTLQRMVSDGQEVILGIKQDAVFGPMVMFGSGGIEVEGLKDIAFGLAHLSSTEAEALIDNTWAGRKLRGYRSIPPADRHAVVEALVGLSQLALDFPEISELEINPLRVLAPGLGVISLDVRGFSKI